MDKPTKYLLIGAALATLIFVGGYLTSLRHNFQLTELVEKCKAETALASKGLRQNYQEVPLTNWESAERVEKNDKGEYRALIGGSWMPVAKAQKNDKGEFRVKRVDSSPDVCDPSKLSRVGLDEIVGIQKQIIHAQASSEHIFTNATIIAFTIFIVLAVPYGWYFFLRRVREIRDAIADK